MKRVKTRFNMINIFAIECFNRGLTLTNKTKRKEK